MHYTIFEGVEFKYEVKINEKYFQIPQKWDFIFKNAFFPNASLAKRVQLIKKSKLLN